LSNVSLIMAVKKIGSVLCAVLGAFEPLTAMCVGIIVFGEPFTLAVSVGFILVLASVMILVLSEKESVKTNSSK
ncbi:MAG: EamA/RhaT family transporter, partial [Prevotella sp.]